jgi:hypothetical protein
MATKAPANDPSATLYAIKKVFETRCRIEISVSGWRAKFACLLVECMADLDAGRNRFRSGPTAIFAGFILPTVGTLSVERLDYGYSVTAARVNDLAVITYAPNEWAN